MISKDSTERLIQELERTAPGNVRFRHAYTGGDIGHGARYSFQPGHEIIHGRTAACAYMIAGIITYNEREGRETPSWVHALDAGLSDRRVSTVRQKGAAWADECFEAALREDAQSHILPPRSQLDDQLRDFLGHNGGMSRSRKNRK